MRQGGFAVEVRAEGEGWGEVGRMSWRYDETVDVLAAETVDIDARRKLHLETSSALPDVFDGCLFNVLA